MKRLKNSGYLDCVSEQWDMVGGGGFQGGGGEREAQPQPWPHPPTLPLQGEAVQVSHVVVLLAWVKEYVDLEDQAAYETTWNGPMGTCVTEFNPVIILNICSAICLPSLSFDTMDPSESWGGTFLNIHV